VSLILTVLWSGLQFVRSLILSWVNMFLWHVIHYLFSITKLGLAFYVLDLISLSHTSLLVDLGHEIDWSLSSSQLGFVS
jgi:hypothetical protein